MTVVYSPPATSPLVPSFTNEQYLISGGKCQTLWERGRSENVGRLTLFAFVLPFRCLGCCCCCFLAGFGLVSLLCGCRAVVMFGQM